MVHSATLGTAVYTKYSLYRYQHAYLPSEPASQYPFVSPILYSNYIASCTSSSEPLAPRRQLQWRSGGSRGQLASPREFLSACGVSSEPKQGGGSSEALKRCHCPPLPSANPPFSLPVPGFAAASAVPMLRWGLARAAAAAPALGHATAAAATARLGQGAVRVLTAAEVQQSGSRPYSSEVDSSVEYLSMKCLSPPLLRLWRLLHS